MPLLSVCIPTYRGGRHLARCLGGVLAQRDVELEVIVGDDASDDDTLEVARGLRDPRVRVHAFTQRAGIAGNWNRTWSLARGDYAALVGQDDWLEPDWGASLVGLLERHREADLAFGRRRFEFTDEAARRTLGRFFEHEYPAMLAPFYARIGEVVAAEVMIEEAMRHRFEINLIGEPAFVVVRRDTPEARAGFHPEMVQMLDWEFSSRFFASRPILHCARELGAYHLHGAGASVGNAPMARHYRECDHMLGSVLERFAPRLAAEQRAILAERRREVRELAARHAAAGT